VRFSAGELETADDHENRHKPQARDDASNVHHLPSAISGKK